MHRHDAVIMQATATEPMKRKYINFYSWRAFFYFLLSFFFHHHRIQSRCVEQKHPAAFVCHAVEFFVDHTRNG